VANGVVDAGATAGSRADRHRRWPVPSLDLIGVLLPTALAAGLVLYDLGSRSVWIDEGDTYTTASQHGASLWHWAFNDGGNMVTYYLGMHFWVDLFGTSEVALRLPTALAAIATIPVCYYLVRRLFDARAAVFGALFVAASVPFVWWAQTARAYVVALFLLSASTLAFVVAIQTRRRVVWVVYVLLGVLSIYTILLSALVVVAQGISLLVRRWRHLPWTALLAAAAAMAVLLGPLTVAIAAHGASAVEWLPKPGSIFGPADRYDLQFLASARSTGVPADGSVVNHLTVAMLAAWALGGCLFVYTWIRRRGTSTIELAEQTWGYALLIAWFVVPVILTYLISVTIQPVLSDRYLLGALPGASMLAGVACSRLRPWPLALLAGVGLVVMRAWVIMPGYGISLENWRQGVMTIVAKSQPGDCIAFDVTDGYTPFDYYVLHLRLAQDLVPTPVLPASSWESRTPHVLDPESIPTSRMPSVVASCPRLWLVMTHDSGSPPGPGVLPYRVRVYEANKALVSEVNSAYRLASNSGFVGATVSLYVPRAASH